MNGLRMLTLTLWAGESRTALRVTSAPVPAVVGTAMQGTDGRSSGRPSPITSRYCRRSPPLASKAATALPASITLPPPMPMTRSQPQLLGFAGGFRNQVGGRLLHDPELCVHDMVVFEMTQQGPCALRVGAGQHERTAVQAPRPPGRCCRPSRARRRCGWRLRIRTASSTSFRL